MDDEPTPAEFAELFSGDGVARYEEAVMPAAIADSSARFALANIGLPLMVTDSLMLGSEEQSSVGLETLDQAYRGECPPEVGRLYLLGVWRDYFVALNGAEGDVLLVQHARIIGPLASNLRIFLLFLYLTQKTINERGGELDETLKRLLITRFKAIDPKVISASEETWREVIESVRYD